MAAGSTIPWGEAELSASAREHVDRLVNTLERHRVELTGVSRRALPDPDVAAQGYDRTTHLIDALRAVRRCLPAAGTQPE